MQIQEKNYRQIVKEAQAANATLVAVSKTKPVAAIQELYDLGHRDFGENYVQELVDKQSQLPPDIRWHFIGHLQSNKVKLVAPFVHLIHGIDSGKLLKEVDKQGEKLARVINVLLQVHLAKEETKFGFSDQELGTVLFNKAELQPLANVQIAGLMGMASFTEDESCIREEFKKLKNLFEKHAETHTSNLQLKILSMGMSGDYKIALEEGSNMIRIGSLLFGSR